MPEPKIEPSLELLHSYQACIKRLEADREQIDVALKVLRDRLAEHERVEGFKPAGTPATIPITEPPVSKSRRSDWHYDSRGYCDNPGRGY